MSIPKSLYTNNARTTLASSITSTATSIPVVSVSTFPTLVAAGDKFNVTIKDASFTEIITVETVNVGGNTFSLCLRGQEGTTARAFAAGSSVELRLTAGQITELVRKLDIYDSNVPPYFEGSIFPEYHLKQFSSRMTSAGVMPILTPVISGGVITDVLVVSGGSGLRRPRVLVTGAGTSAEIELVLNSSGVVIDANVISGGANYADGTTGLITVDNPVVVLVGDSLSNDVNDGTADGRIKGSSFWDMIIQSFEAQNPNRRISYFNRSLDDLSWAKLDSGVGITGTAGWYVNTSKNLKNYLRELRPDLIIFALGLRDNDAFDPIRVSNLYTATQSWENPPDVIFATPPLPSAVSGAYTSPTIQSGVDLVAGYLRTFAAYNNLGFMDFHRQSKLLREGKDVRLTYADSTGGASNVALPYTASESGTGFVAYLNIPFATNFWVGRTVSFGIGKAGTNFTANRLGITQESGFYKITVVNTSTLGTVTTVEHRSQVPVQDGGTFFIVVVVKDNYARVSISDRDVYLGPVPRAGGEFPVSIIMTPDTPDVYPLNLFVEKPVEVAPRLTNEELYSEVSFGPTGGNQSFHFTTLGVAHVYGSVLTNTRLTPAGVVGGTGSYTTSFRGIGTSAPKALFHLRNRPLESGSIFPPSDAGTFLIEDELTPGMTILSGDSGAPRINLGSYTYPNMWSTHVYAPGNRATETLFGQLVRDVLPNQVKHWLPQGLRQYTVATLPAMAAGDRAIAWALDEFRDSGVLVYWDGNEWRRVSDNGFVSSGVSSSPAAAPAAPTPAPGPAYVAPPWDSGPNDTRQMY